jgi:hypothetical protein
VAFIDRMKAQDYIDRSREYLDYLEEHIENVRLAFDEVSRACDGMAWVGDDASWFAVREDVVWHDVSKFGKDEFVQYRDHFFPVDAQDGCGGCFRCAVEHHKRENHHHHETAETWADVVHMVVDWTAMGYKSGGTAEQYYKANEDKISVEGLNKVIMLDIFDRLAGYRKASGS